MLAYTLVDGLPSGNRTVWSRQPLQPLVAGPLTPFSYSVLEEVARRAWYQYYDDLGFDPLPRARIVRQHQGTPYLNLTLSAQHDAKHAGVEPLTLVLNREPFAVTKWEKPGFWAGMKLGRNRKKIESTLASYADAIPTITQKAKSWHAKTKELQWTQADVLQVMEEIERVAVDSFKVFFAARHNLELVYNRLLWLTNEQQSYPANVALINNALGDLTNGIEYKIAEQCVALGTMVVGNEKVTTWLAAGDFDNWAATLPDKQVAKTVETFLQNYGHRCVQETEIRNARWEADSHLLFASLHAYAAKQPKPPAPLPTGQQVQRLIAATTPNEQQSVRLLLDQARDLLQTQSLALHAFSYLLAGTQQWAYAAASEAMADERLAKVDDLFFFTLEEVKQMMTGEWNISAQQEIQRTCVERRNTYAEWQQPPAERAPWLLIGDNAAEATAAGVPGAGGDAIGPLRHWDTTEPTHCNGAIIGTDHLDSGWSLILPLVKAMVIAQGTPLDPVVVAARAWHVPVVTTVGAAFNKLINGAQTTVNGDSGHVEQ